MSNFENKLKVFGDKKSKTVHRLLMGDQDIDSYKVPLAKEELAIGRARALRPCEAILSKKESIDFVFIRKLSTISYNFYRYLFQGRQI